MIVIAGIALVPDRWPASYKTIKSLLPQVDRIYVALNGFSYVPWELKKYDKIVIDYIGKNRGGYMKFVRPPNPYDAVITCDDDLIYPETYVADFVAASKRYPGHVLTHHGHNVKGPQESVQKSRQWHEHHRCLTHEIHDRDIYCIGTGVSFYPCDIYHKALRELEYGWNVCDLLMTKALNKCEVPRKALAHSSRYLKYIKPPTGTTIWETLTSDDKKYTAIWNDLGL